SVERPRGPSCPPWHSSARLLPGRRRSGVPITRADAFDLEEGIGQGDRVDVAGQRRIDDEDHRKAADFARRHGLLLEAEALDLAEVPGRNQWRITGYRLAGGLLVARVDQLVFDGGQLARVHVHGSPYR